MGSILLRTVQVLAATLLIACAILGILWVLGLVDPAELETSLYRVGSVIGICLATAVGLVLVFSIGRKIDE